MAIVALKCPNCRGDLQMDSLREYGFCQFCGTKIMIQEEIVNIVNNINGAATIKNIYSGQTTVNNNFTITKGVASAGITPSETEGHYEGPVDENGRPHGKGLFVWSVGICYQGDFNHGTIDGEGVKTYPDSKYTGSFKNNLRSGHGVVQYNDGRIIEGNFDRDVLSELICEKGDDADFRRYTYFGKLRNGLWHGPGRIEWEDGSSYEGDFFNGTRHGLGIYRGTIKNKSKIVALGEFKKNIQDGEGIIIFPESRGSSVNYIEGTFHDFIIHGCAKVCHADGSWEYGTFKEGQYDGKIVFCSKSGIKITRNYVNGEYSPTTSFVFTYPNTDIHFERINNFISDHLELIESILAYPVKIKITMPNEYFIDNETDIYSHTDVYDNDGKKLFTSRKLGESKTMVLSSGQYYLTFKQYIRGTAIGSYASSQVYRIKVSVRKGKQLVLNLDDAEVVPDIEMF